MRQIVRPPLSGISHYDPAKHPQPKPRPRVRAGTARSGHYALAGLICFLLTTVVVFLIVVCCLLFQEHSQRAASAQSDADLPPIVTPASESHGDTLAEVLSNIRNESYEIFAAFDNQGNKLFEYTEHDPMKVNLPTKLLTYYQEHGGAYIAHNHLSHTTPFSFADLQLACIFEVSATIVTTYDYDIYLMPATETSGWPGLTEVTTWQNDHHSNVADGEYWVAETIVDSQSGVLHNGLSTTDKLVQEFADDFGLTFYKTAASQYTGPINTEILPPL